jgi:hypothetical protein
MRTTRNTKIRQLDSPILIGEDVGSLDIAVDHTLVVEIDQSLQHLGDVHRYEVFRKLAESFGDGVKGTVLAEPGMERSG